MLMKTEPPSIAQIVASVAKTAEHNELERRVVDLRGEQQQITADQRKIWSARAGDGRADPVQDKRLAEMAARLNVISEELAPLRRQLTSLREEHGKRVSAALAPMRADAAGRILELLSEIEQDSNLLAASMIAIEQAGWSPHFGRVALDFNSLREQLMRIASPHIFGPMRKRD